MQAIFEHDPYFQFRNFTIEKTVKLPADQFEKMLRHPMDDYDCLKENAGLTRADDNGACHCLLVTGAGRPDGLLVDRDGCDRALYVSYVPETTALRYPSLLKMNRDLAAAVDFMIENGTSQTAKGHGVLSFDELERKAGLRVKGSPYLQELLGNMLWERPEVAGLSIADGCFHVDYCLDFCPDAQRKNTPGQTLRDLIENGMPTNTYLIHPRDVGFIPVGILDAEDLETGVLNEFVDLLDANVISRRSGAYGQEICLGRISADRLIEFDNFLTTSIADTPVPVKNRKSLRDLIQTPAREVQLFVKDVESEPAIIEELSDATLTEAGKRAWADVLDAEVCRVYRGTYGPRVELEGVEPSRLREFSAMLAGRCSEKNLEKWVTKPEEASVQSPVLKL